MNFAIMLFLIGLMFPQLADSYATKKVVCFTEACTKEEKCSFRNREKANSNMCGFIVVLRMDCSFEVAVAGTFEKTETFLKGLGKPSKNLNIISYSTNNKAYSSPKYIVSGNPAESSLWTLDKGFDSSKCNDEFTKILCLLLSDPKIARNRFMCPDPTTTTMVSTTTVLETTRKSTSDDAEPSKTATAAGILVSTTPKAAGKGSTTPATRMVSSTAVFLTTNGSIAEGFGSSVSNPSDQVPEFITRHFRNRSFTKRTTEVLTSTTIVMESTEDSTTEAAAVVAGGLSALLIAIIVVSVILVILLVGGVIFFYLKKRKRTQKPKKQKVGDTLATAEVSAATRNRTKKKLPKVAKYKKMESATIKPEEFKFTGPLKLTSGGKGSMRHSLDGKSDHSIKDPVEFDAGLNEIVQIGTDIEVLEPSASISRATDKTAVTTKSEISVKKAKN